MVATFMNIPVDSTISSISLAPGHSVRVVVMMTSGGHATRASSNRSRSMCMSISAKVRSLSCAEGGTLPESGNRGNMKPLTLRVVPFGEACRMASAAIM
ncbi:hypothetical protein D3C75_870810 [compost metagenome]